MNQRNSDNAERMAVGCMGLLFASLSIAWLLFMGWMIYWVVSWLTNK